MTFVRVPAGKSGRATCSASSAHLGPLFAGKRGRCRERGEWGFAGHPEHGRRCTSHMLEIVASVRAHDLRTTGYGAHPPMLCGGIHYCRDWRLCQVECSGDSRRRGCRAMAQPEFAHIRLARPAADRRNRSFAWRRWAITKAIAAPVSAGRQ